jgi:antagonist of KipI
VTGRAVLEVVDGGLLTTVQDGGRPGLGHLGVPLGGACDPWGLAVANLVSGNLATSPALETTIAGLRLRVLAPTLVGIGGADLGAVARPGGRRLRPGASYRLAAGDEIDVAGPSEGDRGARAYVALPGGLDTPLVLGSASTCLAGGFGGFDGRPLRTGDLLVPGGDDPASGAELRLAVGRSEPDGVRAGPPATVHLLRGPAEEASDALAALLGGAWRVGAEADRMGIRLDGPALPPAGAQERPSHGVTWGTIQLPPDGRPIVLLADAQPTGGYPVVGVAISADRPVLGQLRPGDPVRFVEVTMDAARTALRTADDSLRAAVEELADAARWDGLWQDAGA